VNATLTVADARAAAEAAEKARDDATAAVDDLRARIESGDLTIPRSAVREAFEAAEYADLCLTGARTNLATAIDQDTREKADLLLAESRAAEAADLAELGKATAPLSRVIGHILATAARVKSHDADLKSRALALLPAGHLEADPELRSLPSHLAPLFAFGEFNPLQGQASIGRLDPVSAILGLVVETLLAAPRELLAPKLRDRLRDNTVTAEDTRELRRLRDLIVLPAAPLPEQDFEAPSAAAELAAPAPMVPVASAGLSIPPKPPPTALRIDSAPARNFAFVEVDTRPSDE